MKSTNLIEVLKGDNRVRLSSRLGETRRGTRGESCVEEYEGCVRVTCWGSHMKKVVGRKGVGISNVKGLK